MRDRGTARSVVIALGLLAIGFLVFDLFVSKWHLRIAGPAALGVAFGGCPYPSVDGPGASYLADVDRWVEIRGLREVQRGGAQSDTALTVHAIDNGTEGDYTYLLDESFVPGIEWSLRNDGAVWLAMSTIEGAGPWDVGYVVAFGPGGEAFLPGDCQDRFRRHLAERSGEGFLADVVGASRPQLRALFADYE